MQASHPHSHCDVIIVGSGINALVCAALLAKAGRKVHILERETTLGGCIRTEALTLPGFHHDTLSTAYPLFLVGPAYAALGQDLHAAGLEFCSNHAPTGVLLPDGRHLILGTKRGDNVVRFAACHAQDARAYTQALGEIEQNADLIFALLGNELWRFNTVKTLATCAWKQGLQPFTEFFGNAMTPCRAWLERAFQSDLPRALLAPWVLHTGLGPEAPLSALMAKVVAFTLEAVGMPLVKGGSKNIVAAFEKVICEAGGSFATQAHVARVLVENQRALGVTLSDGRTLHAQDIVCNVTPTQLYGGLLSEQQIPSRVFHQAQQYRYGKGNMQIHLALSEAPQWPHADLANVTYLHLSTGVAGVSRAVNEAERGLLPAAPTICVAQPTAVDPSRAPDGQHILWIQLPECPHRVLGDARAELPVPADGQWSPSLREAYADRVIEAIARQVPNLKQAIIGRKVLAPPDLQALNINLVGGDPYGGDCSLDQSFLWRPLRATRNHSTPISHLWHIGASTHPGPGLGAGSGFHVGQLLSN